MAIGVSEVKTPGLRLPLTREKREAGGQSYSHKHRPEELPLVAVPAAPGEEDTWRQPRGRFTQMSSEDLRKGEGKWLNQRPVFKPDH